MVAGGVVAGGTGETRSVVLEWCCCVGHESSEADPPYCQLLRCVWKRFGGWMVSIIGRMTIAICHHRLPLHRAKHAAASSNSWLFSMSAMLSMPTMPAMPSLAPPGGQNRRLWPPSLRPWALQLVASAEPGTATMPCSLHLLNLFPRPRSSRGLKNEPGFDLELGGPIPS